MKQVKTSPLKPSMAFVAFAKGTLALVLGGAGLQDLAKYRLCGGSLNLWQNLNFFGQGFRA